MKNSEIIWRCKQCGKWSFAKQCPKFHERFIEVNINNIEPLENEIIRIIPDEQIAVDAFRPGGWIIKCCPFRAYKAIPMDLLNE